MTPITNKIFLDSSVFVEVFKNNFEDFFHNITQSNSLDCCISDIVCSEYWYQVLGLVRKASPLTIKERGDVGKHISQHQDVFNFFENYKLVFSTPSIIPMALKMMQTYNLLSNDALILATCKAYGIGFLASHDSDFENPCLQEGIKLITPANYTQYLVL
jgi:predicted nucleic acid-binding protein